MTFKWKRKAPLPTAIDVDADQPHPGAVTPKVQTGKPTDRLTQPQLRSFIWAFIWRWVVILGAVAIGLALVTDAPVPGVAIGALGLCLAAFSIFWMLVLTLDIVKPLPHRMGWKYFYCSLGRLIDSEFNQYVNDDHIPICAFWHFYDWYNPNFPDLPTVLTPGPDTGTLEINPATVSDVPVTEPSGIQPDDDTPPKLDPNLSDTDLAVDPHAGETAPNQTVPAPAFPPDIPNPAPDLDADHPETQPDAATPGDPDTFA